MVEVKGLPLLLPAHPSASTAATLRVVEYPGHLALDSEAHWLRSEGSVVGMKVFEGSSWMPDFLTKVRKIKINKLDIMTYWRQSESSVNIILDSILLTSHSV